MLRPPPAVFFPCAVCMNCSHEMYQKSGWFLGRRSAYCADHCQKIGLLCRVSCLAALNAKNCMLGRDCAVKSRGRQSSPGCFSFCNANNF